MSYCRKVKEKIKLKDKVLIAMHDSLHESASKVKAMPHVGTACYKKTCRTV